MLTPVSADAPATIIDRDKAAFSKKMKLSHGQYISHASRQSGRNPFVLVREFIRLQRGRGKLTLPEYVQYGVYDPRNSDDEKSRFISNFLHWPVTRKCCDMTWQAATEDKWLCSHILERSNVPVPQTLAVIDRSDRKYPSTRKISNAADLRSFALSPSHVPFFAKEIRGMVSFGAFLVLAAEQDRLLVKGEGWMDYQTCMDQVLGSTRYLLQPVEENHSFFDQYAESLATVRVCVLSTDDSVRIPFAVLKLPARANIADAFWRPGNLACDLDPRTGTIRKARTKDQLGTTDYSAHPETGSPLIGQAVPHWADLLDLVQDCAAIFAPVRYQSMDIAVTKRGPVLIEINTGGGFDLPQLASGRGFLTDEVRDFFRSCGYARV